MTEVDPRWGKMPKWVQIEHSRALAEVEALKAQIGYLDHTTEDEDEVGDSRASTNNTVRSGRRVLLPSDVVTYTTDPNKSPGQRTLRVGWSPEDPTLLRIMGDTRLVMRPEVANVITVGLAPW